MQEAFQYGFESYTKQKEDIVLDFRDIDTSLNNINCYAYEMIDDNDSIIGGAIVNIDLNNNINHLDFLFVRKDMESIGIGQNIWKNIENLYPNTKKWITCTPYFDQRNIHFYVNKLKFKIVEFYNKYNKDPNIKDEYQGDNMEGMFVFEKEMNNI